MSRAPVPSRPSTPPRILAPKEDPVGALCDEYGYPLEVRRLLERVVEEMESLPACSVLMHGSTARGELTWWRGEDGALRLGSDVEMYVVGDIPPPPAIWKRVEQGLGALQDEVNRSGPKLFHLDFGFFPLEQFRAHPRTFRCWDTRVTGRTLLGPDVRSELPDLDAAGIDLRQLNEVPIHRLWEMAFRLPAAMLGPGAGAERETVFAYVCARQVLDLTTWLLPHAGVLVPTFRGRVERWGEAVSGSPLDRYFDGSFPAFLAECLRAKLRFEFQSPAASIHARALDGFRAGLRFLLGVAPDAGDPAIADAALRRGRVHWHGEASRRRVYEGYLLLRDGQVMRPLAALRWWGRDRRPYQVGFLLHLNAGLQALLAGQDAGSSLDGAERMLAALWYGFDPPRAEDSRERFLALRRGYVDYLVGTSRWFGPRAGYLHSVLDDGA